MIQAILSGVFKLVIGLVNLLLAPIDLLIDQFLPQVSEGLSYVSGFFNWVGNLLPWGVSWFGLDPFIISLFVAYVTFELTVPLMVHTVKLAIKWYDKLKI